MEKRFLILVVDDDADTRELLDLSLQDNYKIITATEGEEAVALANMEQPDLVIMDVNMPGRNGIWACGQLRTNDRTKHIPVLILSSRRELGEKLEAYSVGADDYLEKPFTMAELKAKVGAKLRRVVENTPTELKIGNLVLYVDRYEVEVAGRKAPLSALETRLLAFFLSHPDSVLQRDQILVHVWKDVNVSARTVDAHIVGLRRKIDGFDHEIATVYGAGYALRHRR